MKYKNIMEFKKDNFEFIVIKRVEENDYVIGCNYKIPGLTHGVTRIVKDLYDVNSVILTFSHLQLTDQERLSNHILDDYKLKKLGFILLCLNKTRYLESLPC
jgi:hypothetical protein